MLSALYYKETYGICIIILLWALAVVRLSFWFSIITEITVGMINAPFVTFSKNSRLSGFTSSRYLLSLITYSVKPGDIMLGILNIL